MTDQIYFGVAIVLWIITLIVIAVKHGIDESVDNTELLAQFLYSLLAFAWVLVIIYGVIWLIGKSIRIIRKKLKTKKLIITIGVILTIGYMCSSCGAALHNSTMEGAYKRQYGRCPTYPQHKHFRIYSKRANPEACQFVY